MNIEIRPGRAVDLDAIAQLYDDVIDHFDATTNYAGWKKGVYPTRSDAQRGLDEGELYVAILNGHIVGTMMLSSRQEAAYSSVEWRYSGDDGALVIYTFAVNPSSMCMGIGTAMLDYAIKRARLSGMKALRLDVYEGNLPAIHLYEKRGFEYSGTVSLGLESKGLNWFRLYEKPVGEG